MADTLDYLSAQTWHKIRVGPIRGLSFGEESITDHNLFELDRYTSRIEVYKFNKSEEQNNGADFEWWIGNNNASWLGVRFQAKKLKSGRYPHLGHSVRGQRQYQVLLDQAWRDNVWAFYCFYNGWDGPWPNGVPNISCPSDSSPAGSREPSAACRHAWLQDFGCAIAPAAAVARRHTGGTRKDCLAMEEYLRFSRPWSHLFGDRHSRTPRHPIRTATIRSLLKDWVRAAVAETVRNDDPGAFPANLGVPPDGGLHARLPRWLAARRNGRSEVEGYRPSAAVVFRLP